MLQDCWHRCQKIWKTPKYLWNIILLNCHNPGVLFNTVDVVLNVLLYFLEGINCYADDTQVYMPVKKKNDYTRQALNDCLEEVKAWLALNFLNFNENKTKVLSFGLGVTGGSFPVDRPTSLISHPCRIFIWCKMLQHSF